MSPQPNGYFPASTSYVTDLQLLSRIGGVYGGGGSKAGNGSGSPGGSGAVRIVWPGNTRSFPSTDVGTP